MEHGATSLVRLENMNPRDLQFPAKDWGLPAVGLFTECAFPLK